MLKSQIRTSPQALIYLAGCSAATCEEYASRKSTSYMAMKRHRDITLTAIYYAENFSVDDADKTELKAVKDRLNEALSQYNHLHPTKQQFDLINSCNPVVMSG